MNALTHFLEYLRFTDGISSSDVLSWIFAALAGIIAYKLIDNMQTSIERHSILRDIEDGLSELFNSVIALSLEQDVLPSEIINNKDRVMVRSVLHDDSPWEYFGPDAYVIIENQRYVRIRNDKTHNEWISTQALHELTLRCRRIEKLFKGGIAKRIDLADMFREIVPLAKSGRLEFFRQYYDNYDAECVAYLVMQTIVSCHKYKNYSTVESFCNYYHKADSEIKELFLTNRRIRPIRDFITMKNFKKIVANELNTNSSLHS